MSNFKIGDRVYNINLGYGTIRACTNKGYWLVDWDEKLIRKISDVEYTDNGVDRKCGIFNCIRILSPHLRWGTRWSRSFA
nr:MAG TPA: ATP-dependent DNA helicase [Caudoviricetes sp.]